MNTEQLKPEIASYMWTCPKCQKIQTTGPGGFLKGFKRVHCSDYECCEPVSLISRHTPDDMGGWISVEDRMPDVLGDYLMSYESPDGDTQIAWGFFTSDKKWANGNSFYVPTHWMPLPPGPVK
jgi:hypothetical protein